MAKVEGDGIRRVSKMAGLRECSKSTARTQAEAVPGPGQVHRAEGGGDRKRLLNRSISKG